MSKFQETLESGKFVVTVEASPPKGVNIAPFEATLAKLAGKVDAVNMPDGRSARIHLSPVCGSLLAKEKGVAPIYTACCRDRNRLSLSADLLGAAALGITDVLCVSGDFFNFGDTVDAKPVYDIDSVHAIQLIHELEAGTDIGGNALDGNPKFCVGAVGNPQANPLQPQLLKLAKKLEAGIQFVQTLDIFDWEQSRPFFDFLKDKGVKVIAGIRLIGAEEVELAEAGKLPGNPIPAEWLNEIKQLEDPAAILAKAKERMVAMIKAVKASGLAHGVHLTLDGHEDLLPDILQAAGL